MRAVKIASSLCVKRPLRQGAATANLPCLHPFKRGTRTWHASRVRGKPESGQVSPGGGIGRRAIALSALKGAAARHWISVGRPHSRLDRIVGARDPVRGSCGTDLSIRVNGWRRRDASSSKSRNGEPDGRRPDGGGGGGGGVDPVDLARDLSTKINPWSIWVRGHQPDATDQSIGEFKRGRTSSRSDQSVGRRRAR